MNGIQISESCHVAQILTPQSIAGGKTCQAFSMENAEHVTILFNFGARGANNPTAILFYQCSNAAGASAQLFGGWPYYVQSNGGAGNLTAGGEDIFDQGPLWATSAGITTFPTSVANIVIAAEIDAALLEDFGLPYIQVVIVDSGNATYLGVEAIVSGMRNAYRSSPSITV
jgi:hypothetical protein